MKIKLDVYKLQRIYEIYGGEEQSFEDFLLKLCNEGVLSVNKWYKILNYYSKHVKRKD